MGSHEFAIFCRRASDAEGIVDLQPFGWLDAEYTSIRAVGWLGGKDTSVTTGKIHLLVLQRLLNELEQSSFQPSQIAAQKYSCPLCVGRKTLSASTRSGVIWVPTGREVYLAPGNLVHLIYDHSYMPPEPFQRAVEECPVPGSLAYYHMSRCAVRGSGPDEWRDALAKANQRASHLAGTHLAASTCPYCERPLRSPRARQCAECGLDWHDLTSVRLRGAAVESSIADLLASL